MSHMFFKCSKLQLLIITEEFNTLNVEDMEKMFSFCSELEYLDLSNFNTSNVTNMTCMFAGCNELKEIKGTGKFNTAKVKYMNNMFEKCKELKYLDLSNFNTSNVIDMSNMFGICTKLKNYEELKILIQVKQKICPIFLLFVMIWTI